MIVRNRTKTVIWAAFQGAYHKLSHFATAQIDRWWIRGTPHGFYIVRVGTFNAPQHLNISGKNNIGHLLDFYVPHSLRLPVMS